MKDYLYDGTFEGILTCIYHHYYTEQAAGIYLKEEYQPSLLYDYMEVETEEDKATRVYDAIKEKISDYSLRCIYRAYLSSVEGKENAILRYVVLGFRAGHRLGSLHGNPVVKDIENIVKKISVEKERMLQFVRFEVMEWAGTAGGDGGGREILYARVEPDHDVLELVADHFADRFRNDPLIICDVGRNKAIVAYEGSWYSTRFSGMTLPDGSELHRTQTEKDYKALWRTYFDHIAIKERTNPRCQKNFMPVRYWKHLTEML